MFFEACFSTLFSYLRSLHVVTAQCLLNLISIDIGHIHWSEKICDCTFPRTVRPCKHYDFGLSMSSATLALIRQAVRTQSMSFSMRDENGFTPAQAAELQKRIDEIEQGNVIRHDLIEG